MIKRIVIAVVLLIIVCGGLVGFNIFRSNAIKQFFANFPRPAITVSTVEVKPATWTPGIDTFGTVYAASGTDVAVQAAGVVKDILFEANKQVAAGDVLVQIDDSVERADLLADNTAVSLAQQALDRARTLAKQGVTSTVTVDTAEGNLDTATSQLAKIQATIDQKAIKARFPGIIGIPRVNVGQYVQVGTIVATLQDLSKMKVDFTLPEQELKNLHVGQSAKFGATEGNLTLAGQITGIDPKVDPQTRLVSVQALIDNVDNALRPGQFIRIRVELPEEPNVIALPQTSVVPSLYGDFVFAVEPAPPKPNAPAQAQAPADAGKPAAPSLQARQVFVKTGRRNGGLIEIAEGLKAGEQVVTAGQNRLSSGTPVVVDNTIDPSRIALPTTPGTP
jgi:membrane fusion protein (multidrug efflux system)